MPHSICENIKQIELEIGNTQLVVVSKYRSIAELEKVYECGHRHFGENRVQELVEKQGILPKDINWHAIGHLQSNKVKYIAPFVCLIHSIDSIKLLKVVDKEAKKNNRIIPFLFQLHIAAEETKFGLSSDELANILSSSELKELTNVQCKGVMGMATNTLDRKQVETEFKHLSKIYLKYKEENDWDTLSMGMSGDYTIATNHGSTMIRIGSKIFN
ncbi:MAG: YggS family pyridoxal phosphate-dependent enzyme [Bacteroidetes bacterium]|nr:MAG: YggS family pyridoxal phosphate-dependent enzyme [Bacteroidota bacterium]